MEQSRSRVEQLQAERDSLAQQLHSADEAHASEKAALSERLAALEKLSGEHAAEREANERELKESHTKLNDALTQSILALSTTTLYSVHVQLCNTASCIVV